MDISGIWIYFTKKKIGVDVDPTFKGEYIKTSLVLIGRSATLYTETKAINTAPYMRFIYSLEENGFKNLFLLAMEHTIPAALKIANRLELLNTRFKMESCDMYKIKNNKGKRKAICIQVTILRNN